MTVRVIALESCSASHLLPVSHIRSRSGSELLHEGPQLQLGVGLNFTRTRQKLSIQVTEGGRVRRTLPSVNVVGGYLILVKAALFLSSQGDPDQRTCRSLRSRWARQKRPGKRLPR